jgi:Skp family chaperone for outer membrane proteins
MRNVRKALGVIFLAAVGVAATPFLAGPLGTAAAQAASANVIAVVSFQEILRNSKAAKGVQAQFEKKRDSYRSEFSAQENELRQADQELGRQKTLLSAEAFAQKQQEFRQRMIKMQRAVQTRRRQLEQAISVAMREINSKLLEIVRKTAESKSVNLLIPRSQILYTKGILDITDETLKQLNKQLPAVKLTVAEIKPEPTPEATPETK